MGFYFRKSKSFGPFRLNISKTGLGLSTGIKGARLSFGPKGTYINIGRNGVYYKKKIGGKKSKAKKSNGFAKNNSFFNFSNNSHFLNNVCSNDNQSYEFKKQKNNALEKTIINNIKRTRIYRLVAALIAFFICAKISWYLIIVFVYLYLNLWQYFTAFLNYNLDSDAENSWHQFCDTLVSLKECSEIWIDLPNSPLPINIYKELITIKLISPFKNTKMSIRSNEILVKLESKHYSFLFLPNCIIFKEGSKIYAYSFTDIQMMGENDAYIERGKYPKDAKVLNYVWEHTTKDGYADLRYTNNNRYPYCSYGHTIVCYKHNPLFHLYTSREDTCFDIIHDYEAYLHIFENKNINIDKININNLNDDNVKADNEIYNDSFFDKFEKVTSENDREENADSRNSINQNIFNDNTDDIFAYLKEDDGNEL